MPLALGDVAAVADGGSASDVDAVSDEEVQRETRTERPSAVLGARACTRCARGLCVAHTHTVHAAVGTRSRVYARAQT